MHAITRSNRPNDQLWPTLRAALGLWLVAVASGCTPSAQPGDAGAPDLAGPAVGSGSKIEHVIVLWQENHTFDSYFGAYCTAPTGSNPTCNEGPACCEAAPAMDPAGHTPTVLDDAANAAYSPDHHEACEVAEIDGGKMDHFVDDPDCGSPKNFAYVDPALVAPYHSLAAQYALADRYFQPTAGQSSMNDMYFARANLVFVDNAYVPDAVGADCGTDQLTPTMTYDDPTIGDVLDAAHVPWAFYAEGYAAAVAAAAQKPSACPMAPADCPLGVASYPCIYDPGDIPFDYYQKYKDNPRYMRDLDDLLAQLQSGNLPSVAFVRGAGYHSEHPALGTRISDGVRFVQSIVAAVLASPEAGSTLLLLTYDEGGGYFDHVAPPPKSPIDGQPYGTRLPMLAIGPFAKKNHVSHVVMEHSSIVKFIEWNFTGQTGQLLTRDGVVNDIGDLLDPQATGVTVPAN